MLNVKLPLVLDIRPFMGCDPEFFFKLDGEVIGAEKFIPKDGLVRTDGNVRDASKFIIDGVQAELNPRPNYCRANLASELSMCFQMLKKELKSRGKGIKADFSRTVEISEKNLMELDEKSRKFGCAPSKSIYTNKGALKIEDIDPVKYKTRAAGGHIHIGTNSVVQGDINHIKKALGENHEKTIIMLDLLCGNTCVLVDRDAGNIERRKVYGRAGEFRLPKHGLEYRVLSNFWLTSYPLMSLAFGMARLAVQLSADPGNSDKFFKAFTSRVKSKNIHDAINNNDFDLAMSNFKAVKDLILEVSHLTTNYAINSHNIKEFHYFVETIKEKGLNHWFPTDPLEHWSAIADGRYMGFNDFLTLNVRKEMIASKKKAA